MSLAFSLIRDLTPLNRVFCGPDYDLALDHLRQILPLEVREYPAHEEHNGWVIPPRWEVTQATISLQGEVIWDGLQHPLAVIALSRSFAGTVTTDELRSHLHYDHRYEDVIPFHFRQQYRSWDRDWGFCVPKTFYDQLPEGEFDVVIETCESPGVLRVAEYLHKGAASPTFAFVAHLDHPGMANDDLAGVAVAVETFARLTQRRTKFSYLLLLVQEIIGSEYWLARSSGPYRSDLVDALFLEMLGTDTELALQRSVSADGNLERAVLAALEDSGLQHRTGPFKSIIVNDEYVWESYGIPMASLSRYPYPEYHTNLDDASIIRDGALAEAVDLLLDAIERLEHTTTVQRRFKGTMCLSNPQFDLYVDPGQPAFGDVAPDQVQRLRLLMDLMPTLQRPTTTHRLAERTGLEEIEVLAYVRRWEEKGLVRLV